MIRQSKLAHIEFANPYDEFAPTATTAASAALRVAQVKVEQVVDDLHPGRLHSPVCRSTPGQALGPQMNVLAIEQTPHSRTALAIFNRKRSATVIPLPFGAPVGGMGTEPQVRVHQYQAQRNALRLPRSQDVRCRGPVSIRLSSAQNGELACCGCRQRLKFRHWDFVVKHPQPNGPGRS